jgi:hypothetical protein
MKIKSLFVAVLLMAGVVVAPPAQAAEKPVVESFTFSPQDIDLSGTNSTVTFELIVSHPDGIENTFTLLTLKNSRSDSLTTTLIRTDSQTATKSVKFSGSVTIPKNFYPGVYSFSASSLQNSSSAGYQYETGVIENSEIRSLIGAKSGLLVRSGGELNLDFATFVGPTYDSSLGIAYDNPSKFNSSNLPIWKVGETFDPSKYFELRVPTLSLNLKSSTPKICSTDGKSLKLLSVGDCSFTVYTEKTKDYLENVKLFSTPVAAARTKPTFFVEKVADQDVKDLGKSIELSRVYSSASGYLFPQNLTPNVCYANGFFVKLISGGTCKLSFQSEETSTYLASDLYTVSFDILKDGQPVVAPTPVVTPAPTPTAKPVVKKTITCVKGKKIVKRTAVSPKCPKGYKLTK